MNLKFSVNMKGLELTNVELDKKLKRVLFKSMNKMENLSKIYVPVDTGELRRSIDLNPKRLGAKSYILSTGVNYGYFVEMGTKSMIKAHGVHDPKSPVTDWKAKRDRNASDSQRMPFFRTALIEVEELWLKEYYKSEFRDKI
jgi:hypothetical protein